MSIPSGIARIVFIGHMAGGESFETGYWNTGDYSTQALVDDAAQDALTAFAANGTALQALITADSGYDEIRVYGYPTGGPNATFVGVAETGGAVGTGAGSLPDQCALVATLLTGAAGRRRRGRMYLPCNGVALTDHQVPNSAVDNVAAAVAGILGFGAPTPGHEAVVLSQVAGTANPVTQVRVDSRVDIQRRRAENQTVNHTHTENV